MRSNNTLKSSQRETNRLPQRDGAQESEDEMLPEYDFSGGVQGKHWEAYQQAIRSPHKQADAQDSPIEGEKSPDGI